jgi:lysophospholipase L1-like esterase
MRFFCSRLALIAVFVTSALGQGDFFLKKGDTVVFYGDSITDQRLYTTFAETYVVTRFPDREINFIHSGWGGDRVKGGGGGPIEVRLQRDVFAYKPTVMTIMLGMNDGGYRAFDQEIFNTYAEGYKRIISSVKAANPNTRITVIEPSPYDDVTQPARFPGGYNAVLIKYGEFLRGLAQSENLSFADLNTSVVAALQKANAMDHENAVKILPDRVHPGPAGHILMAEALLKAWNAPAIVTSVKIDAASASVTNADNTKVAELKKEDGLTWAQFDRALPMPLDFKDPVGALALKASDLETALNQELLSVTGLTPGRYKLRIDGQDIGSYSDQQLQTGINLAMLDTPMHRQATEVHALTLKHSAIHNTRWRVVQVPLENDHLAGTKEAIVALDRLDADLIQLQRWTAQPKLHRYQVVASRD